MKEAGKTEAATWPYANASGWPAATPSAAVLLVTALPAKIYLPAAKVTGAPESAKVTHTEDGSVAAVVCVSKLDPVEV